MPITNQFGQQNLIRRHGNIPKLASTHGSTTTTLDLIAIPYQPQTKRTAYPNSAIKQQKNSRYQLAYPIQYEQAELGLVRASGCFHLLALAVHRIFYFLEAHKNSFGPLTEP
jgi:hypothetical protein